MRMLVRRSQGSPGHVCAADTHSDWLVYHSAPGSGPTRLMDDTTDQSIYCAACYAHEGDLFLASLLPYETRVKSFA
jgi:hypothetical protein